jgi:hypothetical protein
VEKEILMTDRCRFRVRVCPSVYLTLVAAVALTACGASSSTPRTARTTTASTVPTGGSSTVASTTGGTPATTAGIIQGTDDNNAPYGDFKVTVKVAPHLSSVDSPGGLSYTPETPLQPDGTCQSVNGYCDPAGYKYVLFTLTFTNPTSAPEQFGTVGFVSAIGSMVYPAAPSTDRGITPESSFGGPTNGLAPITNQNTISYWQADRKGPGDLLGFPESFATGHFIFQVTPDPKYFGITGPPGVLAPGKSFDIDYSTTGVVAPKTPLSDLTLWVGVHPQQVH